MKYWLAAGIVENFPELGGFDTLLSVDGEMFRDLPQRQTLRLKSAGRSLFLKRHLGVGWREIAKNFLQFRLPVIGAENEFLAIRRLEALAVETMTCVGFGKRGISPASQQSFVLTEDLVGSVSLEEFVADWPAPPFSRPLMATKRGLIQRLATISARLHDNGVNHRDYYICHFHLWPDELLAVAEARLVLIDLHRVQIRKQLPRRWRHKDIAGLYFSAMDAGLTRRDCLRFIRAYRPGSLREIFAREPRFWRQVEREARRLYFKAHRRYPPQNWPGLQR